MTEMRLLEILSAFAEAGTQAAAAERLHISQPTLSSAMKKLEEEIGAPLFKRSKNRMVQNENGKTAAEFAARILHEEAEMRARIQEMEQKKHTVSFATCTRSATVKMSMLIAQAFPEKQMTTTFLTNNDEMMAGLLQGQYTFMISEMPVLDERVITFPCYTERLIALIPEEAPEAGRDSISLNELKDHQMLFLSNGGAWERYISRKMGEDGFIRQSNFADYCALLNSVPVWGFASDTHVHNLSVPPNHKAVPVSDEDAHLDYWCSCLKANKKEADKLCSFL